MDRKKDLIGPLVESERTIKMMGWWEGKLSTWNKEGWRDQLTYKWILRMVEMNE